MAVTFRSKNEVVGSGTSPTPVEPAGAISGDALLALYMTASGAAPTLPAGWTTLYGPTTQGSVVWRVGYIIRGGSAPSYAFTHTGSVYREVHVLCLQGAATITLDSQSAAGTTGSGTTNPNPPATTAVASSSLAVCGGLNFFGSGGGGWVTPAGYVIRTRNTAGDDSVMATKSLAASGSEDPAGFTGVGGSGDFWNGFTATFTDAGGGGGGAVLTSWTMGLMGVQ